jgi:hypothetical protein
MRLDFGDGWFAKVTDEPLRAVPRFTGDSLSVGPWTDPAGHVRFFTDTFGSEAHLWDDPDVLRFTADTANLAGVELQLPQAAVPAAEAARVPLGPGVRPGGIRAEQVRDFRHPMYTVLCRAADDAVLTCLRDIAVLDEPLDARIGIGPDVALLLQRAGRHGPVLARARSQYLQHVRHGGLNVSMVHVVLLARLVARRPARQRSCRQQPCAGWGELARRRTLTGTDQCG